MPTVTRLFSWRICLHYSPFYMLGTCLFTARAAAGLPNFNASWEADGEEKRMSGWISTLGTLIAAVASFVVAWSALRPRQRTYAKRFFLRWAERVAVALAACYFIWVNARFVLGSQPVGRLEILVLILANAEAVILLILLLFVHVFSAVLDKRKAQWEAMHKRMEKLELVDAGATAVSQNGTAGP